MIKFKIENNIYEVPENEINEFLYTAKINNIKPIKYYNFSDNNNNFEVPEDELKSFFREAKKNNIKPISVDFIELPPAEKNMYNQLFNIKPIELNLSKKTKEKIKTTFEKGIEEPTFEFMSEEQKKMQDIYTEQIKKQQPKIKDVINKNYATLLTLENLKESGKYQVAPIEAQINAVKDHIQKLNDLNEKFNNVLNTFEEEKKINAQLAEDSGLNSLIATTMEAFSSLVGFAGNIIGRNIKDEKKKK